MIAETKHCLKNVTNFQGRDARQTFWFYVLFLVLLNFAIGIISAIPTMVSAVGSSIDAAQSGASQQEMEAAILAETASSLGSLMWISVTTKAATAALFVSAFARRLHDGGFTGWIAAVPVLLQAAAIYISFGQTAQLQEIFTSGVDMAEMQRMQAEITSDPLNYLTWIGYLVVIGFGVIKSQQGPNRFAEPPQPL